MAIQIKAKLIKNIEVAKNYYKILLYAPGIVKLAKPGQFVEIKVTNTLDPILRRPLSIHCVCGSRIELLFEVVGKGTEILSQKKAGEYLDIIGPLGNGFRYQLSLPAACLPARQRQAEAIGHQLNIIIAGGMGVAPLVFLAEKLTYRKPRTLPCRQAGENREPLVLIGAKTKNQILCEKEFKNLGCEVKIATDDGSRGFKGKVTDLLKKVLRTTNYELRTIYACGPRPMLKEIAQISRRYNIAAQISLEEHMSCGIGACLGCVVNTKDGYRRVCKEGPVFNVNEVLFEKGG